MKRYKFFLYLLISFIIGFAACLVMLYSTPQVVTKIPVWVTVEHLQKLPPANL